MIADGPPVPPVSPQAAALTLLDFVQCVELTWDTLWFQRHNKCYFKQRLVLKLLKIWRCCRPHVSSWSVGDLKSVQNDHFCREIKRRKNKADRTASKCSKLVQCVRAKHVAMIRNLEQIFISQNDAVLHDILSIQRELRGLLMASLVMSAVNGDQLPNQNIIFMYLRFDVISVMYWLKLITVWA